MELFLKILPVAIGVVIVIIQIIANVRIAKINYNLNIKNERKKQLFEDEKQAIYEFYKLINSWILCDYRTDFYGLVYDEDGDYTLKVEREIIKLAQNIQGQKS